MNNKSKGIFGTEMIEIRKIRMPRKARACINCIFHFNTHISIRIMKQFDRNNTGEEEEKVQVDACYHSKDQLTAKIHSRTQPGSTHKSTHTKNTTKKKGNKLGV